MNKKTAFITAAVVPLGTLVVLWLLKAQADASLLIGTGIGVLVAWTSIWMFYKTIFVKDKGGSLVAFWYGARVVITFGSIILSLFVPWMSSLGVIVPQLFPIPVIAIFMITEK